jgi:hypothetical protein
LIIDDPVEELGLLLFPNQSRFGSADMKQEFLCLSTLPQRAVHHPVHFFQDAVQPFCWMSFRSVIHGHFGLLIRGHLSQQDNVVNTF